MANVYRVISKDVAMLIVERVPIYKRWHICRAINKKFRYAAIEISSITLGFNISQKKPRITWRGDTQRFYDAWWNKYPSPACLIYLHKTLVTKPFLTVDDNSDKLPYFDIRSIMNHCHEGVSKYMYAICHYCGNPLCNICDNYMITYASELLPRCCGCHKGCQLRNECKLCNKSFITKTGLMNHKQTQHAKIKKCPHCDYNGAALHSHRFQYHSHQCPQCHKKFIEPEYLEKHIDKKHPNTQPPKHPNKKIDTK